MTTKKRYSASETCVYNLGFHLIWCTKYRRNVLTPEIESRLKELICEKADELEVEIVEMEQCLTISTSLSSQSPHTLHIFLCSSLRGIHREFCVRNLQSCAPVFRLCGRVRISASLSDVFRLIP